VEIQADGEKKYGIWEESKKLKWLSDGEIEEKRTQGELDFEEKAKKHALSAI